MKIYTKGGDAGETGLFGGSRVPKDHLRIQAYGTLDELNATIGVALASSGSPDSLKKPLIRIQGELFQLGAELATPAHKKIATRGIGHREITQLEHEIDQMEVGLPALKTFILPSGNPASSQLHFARTVSRRAERELVTLHHSEPVRAEILQYVNRLSDYLFVCARWANHVAQIPDLPWIAPS